MSDVSDERKGQYLVTFSGKRLYPADPRPDEFDIKDIARGLSNMCRFNGHTRQFYSVAQHSVLCAAVAPDHLKLDALLHDATEAYIADIVRPAKSSLPDYMAMEEGIHRAIAEKYALSYPMSAELKEIDNRMLITEARFLLRPTGDDWWKAPDAPLPYDITMVAWTPEHARQRFTEMFNLLMTMRSVT